MTATLLIALLLGGGTSYAAENAIPGDLLYPVKVDINENVKSAFAVGDDAEAKLQADLARERLKEAEVLASRGTLDAAKSAELETRLKDHLAKADAHSQAAFEKGDLEARASVESAIEGAARSYIDVLSGLNANVNGNHGDALIDELKAVADVESTSSAETAVSASTDASAQVRATIDAASAAIHEMEAKLDSFGTTSTSLSARITASAKQATDAESSANALFEQGNYQAAYVRAKDAIRSATFAEVLIDSALHIRTDAKVEGKGTLEDLIGTSSPSKEDEARDERSDGTNGQGKSTSTDVRHDDADIEANEHSDADVKTDLIDAHVDTDTSLKSHIGL
ncbi:MAG TPA: DUF5667 domain-containing protein [Candidatus Paceibacterota bacterium]|nr:DUF5667 domain-containing protein [Candidatus Paceibacterota bacterium]